MAVQSAAAKKAAFKNQAKKNAKGWTEKREAKGSTFDLPKIEEGIYKFVITGDYEVASKGKLKGHSICRLIATLAEPSDGAEEGCTITQMYDLSRAATEKFDPQKNLVRDLKRVFPAKEEEINASDGPGDMADIIDDLNADPPTCFGEIKHDYAGEGDNAVLKYVNIQFRDPVDGAEPAAADEGGEIDPDEPEAEAEGDDVEPEPEAEEEGDWEPAKDNKVSFVNRGKKMVGKVVSVNRAETTARIKDDKSGRIYPLAWDKLTFISVS